MKLAAARAGSEPPHFHTCFALCDFVFDNFLENALVENCSLADTDATLFDTWIHRVCYATSSPYNRG
jgi:hypothetical protein